MNKLTRPICLSIFLLPMASLIPIQGTIVWYPQYLCLIAVGFCVASFYIWQVNKPLAILSLYSLYSYFFVAHQHPRALLCLVICYGGIGFISLLSQLKETSIIVKSLIGMALIQFALVILQRFNLDPFFHLNGSEGVSDTVGFLGSHNQLAAYYATISPILFHVFLPLVAVSCISIFFAHCSTAAIGMIVGILTYLFFMKSKILFLLLIPVLAVTLLCWKKLDPPTQGLSERISVWKLTLKQAVEGKAVSQINDKVNRISTWNPLTGAGIGSFLMISPSTQFSVLTKVGHRYEHAHNDFVEFIFEFGWLGIPILLWLILDIFMKFLSVPKTNMVVLMFSSLVAQAISSMGVYVIHAPVSYFMMCLILGLFYVEVSNARISQQKA